MEEYARHLQEERAQLDLNSEKILKAQENWDKVRKKLHLFKFFKGA